MSSLQWPPGGGPQLSRLQRLLRCVYHPRWVPVFLSEPAEMVADHSSNAIGPAFEAILKEGKEFVLHIGAGGTATRFPNCVEFEHKIFRHTDVVGDAHYLPFREGVFDRVFALNVFEHLRDPKLAAAEIFRVLKPGGSLAIHTAFLQAVHEEPDHFYNATEYGVRNGSATSKSRIVASALILARA